MALMGDSEIGTTSATAGAEAMAESAVDTELVFAGFRRLSASGKRVSSLGKARNCQGAGETEPLCPFIVLQETAVGHDRGHEVPRMIAHDFGYRWEKCREGRWKSGRHAKQSNGCHPERSEGSGFLPALSRRREKPRPLAPLGMTTSSGAAWE